MFIFYLAGFNNYYNRQIKKPNETEVADYDDWRIDYYDEVKTFKPNDGVMTVITANIPDDIDVDYAIVSNNSRDIHSRWFVLDRRRNRENQWEMTLRRDLVADNYDAVINAPCFIEKATLPADNKLIYNSEDFTTNQIKEQETPLKDKSGCAWIVGYIARGGTASAANEYIEVPFGLAPEADITVADLTEENIWTYSRNAGSKKVVDATMLKTRVAYLDPNSYNGIGYFEISNFAPYTINFGTALYSSNTEGYRRISQISDATIQNQITNTWATTANYISQNINNYNNNATYNINSTLYNELLSYNNKIVYDEASQKYYRIDAQIRGSAPGFTISVQSGDVFEEMRNGILRAENSGRDFFTGTADMYSFTVLAEGNYVDIELTEIYQESGKIKVHANEPNRITCWDSPFDIICAPYADKTIITGTSNYVQSKDTSLAAMMAYATNQGGGTAPALYDLQLLPYCPIPGSITENGDIDIGTSQHGIIENANGDEIGRVFYAAQSQFTIDIPYTISVPADAVEKKVMNECEMYRLCSPNYNGVFEFSPAKNGGVSKFNVDCSYKPYSPYIHVNPNFGELYGQDFNDARGLICGGDFSLPMANSAWAAYQRENKNYQQTFDRQIENMELTNKIQKGQEIAQAAAGGFSSIAMGVGSGMMLGGPVGAAVVGGLGAGFSIAGGIADVYLNEKLRAEALDMTKDMFGYNLANIQALPYTLTKVSAYNNNNKIFPFVERYSATEIEKEAFRNKLYYDGMTVMTIGSIADYQQTDPTYIKGRIIRLENNDKLDYHSLTELANEIYKGVFI